ncbi:DUF6191 domain-containing protein [Rhodococcus sp. UNC363MFTsu5.1]|uniref:DUF6191 domain-containing protein n=1 Tax=Rhodococcus sp. UNC363MFTsu5.1 TaxID=1449069 RepID=UPI0004840239|nr:DUF6191 domain-containing protein [Rhodococcus sp. UNC363MFTsu5.1]
MGMLFAMTIPGLVCLLVLAAFAETLFNRVTGGRMLPWTRRGGGRTVSATGFEEVTAVFQGSKHHEFEQRQVSLMHREDDADGAPPLVRLDIASNRAVLRNASDAPR